MTTFFTVLILSYAVQGQELQMRMVYETQAECSEMMMHAEALVSDPLAVQCVRSDMISWAPRPPHRQASN